MCFILPVTSLHIGLEDFKHAAFQRVFISNPIEMAIIITLMNNSCIISLDTDGPEAIELVFFTSFVGAHAFRGYRDVMDPQRNGPVHLHPLHPLYSWIKVIN